MITTKKLWTFKSVLALLLAFAGAFWLWEADLTAAPRPLASASGNARIKRKNLRTTTSIQGNRGLQQGDIVSAGRTATSVSFTDGSQVDLASGSSIEITKAASVGKGKTLFRALSGRMTAHLRPGRVVVTRTALVRVKGTVVSIDIAEDGTTTLAVLEGSAEFFNPCGLVLVPAGSQSTVKPGNAPQQPVAIPDIEALLREWRQGSGANGGAFAPATNVGQLLPNGSVLDRISPVQVAAAAAEFAASPRIQSNAQIKPPKTGNGACDNKKWFY